MIRPARDVLDDLVEAVPEHVVPADLADTAWRAGRRRRIRTRLAASAALAAFAGAVALGVLPVVDDIRSIPPAGGEPSGVTSYPERIGHQWWVRDLPDRPGPVAGLIKLVKESPTESKPLGWHVVSPGGHRWRLPADGGTADPTISPDGRHLGYLSASDGPYVLHNLVSGERHEFAIDAGYLDDDVPVSDAPHILFGQNPGFWSPDGTRLLLRTDRASNRSEQEYWSILGVDGTHAEFVADTDVWPGNAAGWVSQEELLVVRPVRADPDDWMSPVESVEATVYGTDGRRLRTLDLVSDAPWGAGPNQWVGGVSPDGTEVAIRGVLEGSPGYYLHRFSLEDGAHIQSVLVPWPADSCGTAWASSRPTATSWDSGYRHLTTGIFEEDSRHPLVTVEPLIGGQCLIWAEDAIGGKPRGGLFGTSTAAWTWWWRELLIGLGGAVAIAAIRRRRDTVG